MIDLDSLHVLALPLRLFIFMLLVLSFLCDMLYPGLSMIDMGSRHRQAVMSDITYHEKSQSDPNAAASEDTVIDVLRRSVDKRVSPILSQVYSFQHAQPGNWKLISILTFPADTSLGIIPRRPPKPCDSIERDRVHLLLPPPNARTVRHHPDLEWHRLRSQGGRAPVQGRHRKGPREVLARGDQGGGQG
jgi:hypothetical protein